MKKLKLKWVKIIAGILITVLALWLSFGRFDWDALRSSVFQVNIFWVILALLNTIFTVYMLGWRWQILLKQEKRIPLWSLFQLNIISQYTNIITPVRLGEVARGYLVSKQHNISGAYVTGTIVIEKIFDFFIFVLLWISVPTLFSLQKEVKAFEIALMFCVFVVCLLVLLIWRPRSTLNRISFLLRVLPGKLRQKIYDFSEKGIPAFGLLKSPKILFFVIVLTFFFVGGQVLTNFVLFKAFNLNLSFWAALFVLLAIQVGNIPPSVPGKIGVFEYATILALSVFGIAKSQALSYAIMLHIVAYLPKILLGFIFIANLNAGLKKIKRKDEKKHSVSELGS